MEEIITNAQHPSEKTVQALREQLDQDIRLLASLDPDSVTHDRLAARVDRQTAQLLDYEDQIDRQRRAAQHAAAERHRRDQQDEARLGGALGILIGAIITYTAWGTWWLALGIVFILGGLYGLLAKDA